jgi:hypothetical protein
MKKYFLLALFLLLPSWAWATAVQDTLRPASDACILWTPYPADGAEYTRYDDLTPDEDTTYVYQTVGLEASPSEGYHAETWSGSGTIDSVRMVIRIQSSKPGSSIGEILFGWGWQSEGIWAWCSDYDNGIDTALTCPSPDWIDTSITWSNNPYDGEPWTTAYLNHSDFGWVWASQKIDKSSNNRVTQSFIVVFSHTEEEGAGKARERRIRLLQEEDE